MKEHKMIGLIAAVSKNGVIGLNGTIPWNYPEDMKHFRKTTANSTVIMGRKTFESIGRPLPKRRNIVISRTNVEVEGIETFSSMKEALESPLFSSSLNGDRWLIGGASIYEEGMQYADEIHLTLTPDIITTSNVVKFPWVSPQQFAVRELRPLEDGSQLMYAIYSKI
jgi:dihydrofolate reductase